MKDSLRSTDLAYYSPLHIRSSSLHKNSSTPTCGRLVMVRIEQLAEAAINHEALLLRSLTQDLLRERPNLREYSRPTAVNFETLAAAASLIELLAERLN